MKQEESRVRRLVYLAGGFVILYATFLIAGMALTSLWNWAADITRGLRLFPKVELAYVVLILPTLMIVLDMLKDPDGHMAEAKRLNDAAYSDFGREMAAEFRERHSGQKDERN